MDEEKAPKPNPHLILPVGTQVVTLVEVRGGNGEPLRRSGSVGKIVKAPTDSKHAYSVVFPDGGRTSLHREELAIRKQVQSLNFDRPNAQLGDRDLHEHIIHLMRTGLIEANLVTLNQDFKLPYVPDLVARKLNAAEKQSLDETDFEFHEREYQRLRSELEKASEMSILPEKPTAHCALDDLLKRARLH
jgi:hypothetical protein